MPAPRGEVRAVVREEWTAALGPPASDEADFASSGGHPLLLARLLARVARRTGYAAPRPPGEGRVDVGRLVDLVAGPGARTAQLPPDVRPESPCVEGAPPAVSDGDVLLTGATGFLGVHLLAALLRHTAREGSGDATVHCLVRGEDDVEARERLAVVAATHEVPLDLDEGRVRVHAGDVTAPGLGVPRETAQRWAGSVGVVVHAAAEVNFLLPAEQLWAANVDAVVDVLRLACRGRRTQVHHVSTLGVLTEHGLPEVVEETAPEPPPDASGYLVSKWAAEGLVVEARRRGLDAWVHRPWVLMGHTQTGATDPADYTSRVLLGCLQLGSAPDLDVQCNLVPVDHAAQAVAWLATAGLPAPAVPYLHHANPSPAPLRQVWEWVRELGHPVDVVPLELWLRRLSASPDNVLRPLLPMLTGNGGGQAALPRISTARSDALLAGSGLRCPPVDRELVAGVLGHLTRRDLLATPGVVGA